MNCNEYKNKLEVSIINFEYEIRELFRDKGYMTIFSVQDFISENKEKFKEIAIKYHKPIRIELDSWYVYITTDDNEFKIRY